MITFKAIYKKQDLIITLRETIAGVEYSQTYTNMTFDAAKKLFRSWIAQQSGN